MLVSGQGPAMRYGGRAVGLWVGLRGTDPLVAGCEEGPEAPLRGARAGGEEGHGVSASYSL
jgi:hypothetical protein